MVSTSPDVLAPSSLEFKFLNRKKNAPYLYDLVITHALDWPTLTCQWLPDKESFVFIFC